MKKIIIVAIFIVFVSVLAVISADKINGSKNLKFNFNLSSSLGESVEYNINNPAVLEKVDESESQFIFNFASFTKNFTFKNISAGETTITWYFYEMGDSLVSEKCYSTTYKFDEKGNYEIISENFPIDKTNQDYQKYLENYKYITKIIYDFIEENNEIYSSLSLQEKLDMLQIVFQELYSDGYISEFPTKISNKNNVIEFITLEKFRVYFDLNKQF